LLILPLVVPTVDLIELRVLRMKFWLLRMRLRVLSMEFWVLRTGLQVLT